MPGRLLPRSFAPSSTASPPLTNDTVQAASSSSRERQPSIVTSPMEQLKRHSLAVIGKGKEKDKDKERKGSPGPLQKPTKPVSALDVVIESPPAVFYGNANQSSGALYAGHLQIKIIEPDCTLNSLTLKLVAITSTRKPVSKDCPACSAQTTELKLWNFLTAPKRYEQGTHFLPFSYLIPGHLPITTQGELGQIQYFLIASGTRAPTNPVAQTSSPDTFLTVKRELHVSRAVRPLDAKTSLRIFPPTNLTARVTHEPIFYPIGDTTVTMHVSGIAENHKETVARWRLRRMNWRLEETEKMISPACSKHAAKVGGEGRGIAHEDVRHVGRGELKSGWKTDLSAGEIELEFVVRPSRPMCDVDSPNGLVVTHSLVIELVIAEEWASVKTPEKAMPTGAARVLRMQFAVMVTERSGMGISWDEEMPPVYEDVPASPPWYPADLSAPLSRGAPPGYAEGIEEEETPDIQRSRSELLNYTGTPLGPSTERFDEEDFEGLTLGPSRMGHRNTSRGAPGPSRLAPQRRDSNGLRQVFNLHDLETEENLPSPSSEETPRPPSPMTGRAMNSAGRTRT